MRKKFGNGGNGLTKAQKTLPPELKKKILMSKGKKTKSKSMIKKAMGIRAMPKDGVLFILKGYKWVSCKNNILQVLDRRHAIFLKYDGLNTNQRMPLAKRR